MRRVWQYVLGICIAWGGTQELNAQIEVQEGVSAYDAVHFLAGRGIKTRGERYAGAPEAMGTWSNSGTVPAFQEALIMSSGKVVDVVGPNNKPKTSSSLMTPGNRDLNMMANSRTFDAAVLDFDFMTDRDSFALNFYFASEEYSEFVGSTYQDVLVILLKGPGMGNGKHLALVPGTKSPVHANSVSISKNRRYYIDNNPYDLNGRINEGQKAKLNPDLMENFQFDGMTRVFSVGARVKPRTKYHLQIMVADAGDGDNDSAVILEGGSMQSYEQYWRIVRRRQIAEQRRLDSLARVQAFEDSIAVVRAYEDSVNAAMNSTLIGVGEPDREVAEAPAEIQVEVVEMEEVTEDWTQPQKESPADSDGPSLRSVLATNPGELQWAFTYPDGEFILSRADESDLEAIAGYLQENEQLKVGLFLPEGAQQAELRFDLVRAELLKAGIDPGRIFKNGFSYMSGTAAQQASLDRIEIWAR